MTPKTFYLLRSVYALWLLSLSALAVEMIHDGKCSESVQADRCSYKRSHRVEISRSMRRESSSSRRTKAAVQTRGMIGNIKTAADRKVSELLRLCLERRRREVRQPLRLSLQGCDAEPVFLGKLGVQHYRRVDSLHDMGQNSVRSLFIFHCCLLCIEYQGRCAPKTMTKRGPALRQFRR